MDRPLAGRSSRAERARDAHGAQRAPLLALAALLSPPPPPLPKLTVSREQVVDRGVHVAAHGREGLRDVLVGGPAHRFADERELSLGGRHRKGVFPLLPRLSHSPGSAAVDEAGRARVSL
jgi:hypothetical protein